MDTSSRIVQYGLKTAFNYIEKNPEQNLPKLMDWVDKLAGDGPNSYPSQRAAIRKVINNPDNNMYQLIINILTEIDPGILKAVFENFFLNANLLGWKRQTELRKNTTVIFHGQSYSILHLPVICTVQVVGQPNMETS